MSQPLVDPGQQFLDQAVVAPPPTPAKLARDPRERIAFEVAGAVLAVVMLMRARLAQLPPAAMQPGQQARNVWKEFAPTWLRLTIPAVTQAYRLGNTAAVSDEEIQQLASTYAQGIGDYLGDTSADAFQDAINAQLAQRWSPELAHQRAVAAYGLDRRDMRRYVVAATKDKALDPIPAAARTMVDRLMMGRAQRIGEEESYSAEQAGQAMTWLYLERSGRIGLGHLREWVLGRAEHHCPVCVELVGQQVPLAEPFLTRAKVKLWAPRAHPGCDCRIRILPPPVEVGKRSKTVAAGLALVAADTGRVLMLQRAHDPSDPAGGTWEFPGGHVEDDEPAAAAVREWEEEVRRKLPPITRMLGTWQHGCYEGFAALIARESLVPTHTRGRVTNPDDPDGDQVEAIAWWDPKHLQQGNPALRSELRQSLRDVRAALHPVSDRYRVNRVSKADDHWKREPRAHGRFARVQEAQRVAQPAVPEPVTESPLRPSPLRSSALRENPLRQSALREDPLKPTSALRSPFLETPPSPFGEKRKRPQSLQRRIIMLPAAARYRPPAPDPDTVHYLPVDAFHEHTAKNPIGARYDIGGLVDFDEAASRPVATAQSPWSLLDNDHLDLQYASPMVDQGAAESAWHDLINAARPARRRAMAEANGDDPIVGHLTSSDLARIATMSGYALESDSLFRGRISRAVAGYQGGQSQEMDSLADAYADYATFAAPQRLLGRTVGEPVDDAFDYLFDNGIDMRVGDPAQEPVPMQQVFVFERGHHPRTKVAGDEAFLEGPHTATYNRYRSAMADFAGDPPLMRLGLRETNLAPIENHNGFWIPPGSAG